jgi:hypothetical protein
MERDRLAGRSAAAAQKTDATGPPELALHTNWMRRTGWLETSDGASRDVLVRLALPPRPEGDGLWLSAPGDERQILSGNGGKAKDPDAMDLDQIRINMAKIPEEERLRRANDGLCFNCGKAGHQARKCRSPTNPGRGGRGGSRGGGQRGGYGGGYGNQGPWQGPPQGYYGPQQGGNGSYFGSGYQQPWAYNGPSNNANANNGNHQGAPARRGGMRGDYRGGYNPQVRFMNVQNPGRVVGEVDSEDNWGGDGLPAAEYDNQSEDYFGQGNA